MAHRSQSAVREIDGDEDGRGVGEPVDDVRGRQVVRPDLVHLHQLQQTTRHRTLYVSL